MDKDTMAAVTEAEVWEFLNFAFRHIRLPVLDADELDDIRAGLEAFARHRIQSEGRTGAGEALREAMAKANPTLVNSPSTNALARLLQLGAENQRPKAKDFREGRFDAEADAAFIVACINFATAALSQGTAGEDGT